MLTIVKETDLNQEIAMFIKHKTTTRHGSQAPMVRQSMKLLLLAASLASPHALAASTFNVNTTVDSGDTNPSNGICADTTGKCSLRAAIEEANALNNNSLVKIPAGRHVLSIGPLIVKGSVIIRGAGQDKTFVSGADKFRVVSVSGTGTSTLSDLTIENGNAPGFGQGGAGLSVAKGASLNLSNCTVRNNRSTAPGGGIANGGYLHLINCTVTRNKIPLEEGGGVQYSGGGLMNFTGSTLKILNSTISYNEATRGGGIRNAGGHVEIVNSTIAGNTASKRGGGIMHYGTTWISYSTISGNTANTVASGSELGVGGGIYADKDESGNITMANSILAGNKDNRTKWDNQFSPDCYLVEGGRFQSARGNVVGILTPNCALKDTTWGPSLIDQVGKADSPLDPKLSALGSNGGTTATMAIGTLSPAYNKGTGVTSANFFLCPSKDQRGTARADGKCDAGAYEYVKPVVPVATLEGVYNLVSRNSNKCLDIKDVSLNNGALTQQWDCANSGNQRFRFELADSGAFGGRAYTIKAEHTAKCLSVQNSGLANGVNIIQWDCFDTPNQKVILTPSTGGSWTIRFLHSNKCMDVAGTSTANGQTVHQWDCSNNADQDWFLRP